MGLIGKLLDAGKTVVKTVVNAITGAVNATENAVSSAEKAFETSLQLDIDQAIAEIDEAINAIEEALGFLGVKKCKTTTGAEEYDFEKSIEKVIDGFKANMEKGRNQYDPKGTENYAVDFLFDSAGFTIDPNQEIYASNKNPPIQSIMGYNHLFDEVATPAFCVIDCEPICFEYGRKSWMIELWKGQYGISTGCEIGVYTQEDGEWQIGGKTINYDCASKEDWLPMSLDLYKEGESKSLFHRESDKHWWLTGFKPGENSRPEDLTMKLSITLKDEPMRKSFLKALEKKGYKITSTVKEKADVKVNGNTVSFDYGIPKSEQSWSRGGIIEEVSMEGTKILSEGYNIAKDTYETIEDTKETIKEAYEEISDYFE